MTIILKYMPTFKKYKRILTSLAFLLAPILLPYVIDLGSIQKSVELFKSGFAFMWLWVVTLIVSLVFAVLSFKEPRAKALSVIIGLCSIGLMVYALFMMFVAAAWSIG